MRILQCVIIMVIAFAIWFSYPTLANSGDDVGSELGWHHAEKGTFASLDHSVLERGKDAVGGGLGPD